MLPEADLYDRDIRIGIFTFYGVWIIHSIEDVNWALELRELV